MAKRDQLDRLDLQILAFLMEDAKMPYTDIAKKLIISSGTVHVRMKKMEDLGVIKSSNLRIQEQKLGYDITAFLGIYLSKSSHYKSVAKELEKIPEVIELTYTTGIYSMFAKVVCKDTTHLRDVLHEKIQNIEEITRTETFISLEETFSRPIKIDVNDAPESEE
ncbi:MAG: Lrp/AsnC ligand binding domain-containing protein [Chitinophagales bacterium]|nr:Lrp/AsnC ligand binding domain-containing protein [Chitinophagales bacterium]